MPRGDVDINSNSKDNNDDNDNNEGNDNNNDNKDNNDGNDNNEGYKNDVNDDESSAEKQSRKHLFRCRIHIFSTRPFLKRPNSFFEVAAAEEKKRQSFHFQLRLKNWWGRGFESRQVLDIFFFLYSLRNRV